MKKRFSVILLILAALLSLSLLSSCGKEGDDKGSGDTVNDGSDSDNGSEDQGGDTATESFTEGLEFELNSDGTGYIVAGYGSAKGSVISVPKSHEGLPVVSIGNYAFSGSSEIRSVKIPDSVTKIGNGAFNGCLWLTEVTVPDSVTEIGYGAFKNCKNLGGFEIPESVPVIAEEVFSGCSGLKDFTVPETVTEIGKGAFSGCSELKCIALPFVGKSAEESKFTHFGYIFGAESYWDNKSAVPASLYRVVLTSETKIEANAFYNCIGLASITLPSTLEEIGFSAFEGCFKLVEICNNSNLGIQKNMSNYGSVAYYALNIVANGIGHERVICNDDGYIFYNSYLVGYNEKNTEIVLPSEHDGKEYKIYDHAFKNCTQLKNITVSNGITGIGESAFSGCTSLKKITISDSVKSIDGSAFYGCTGLTSITIPNGVTSISASAFKGCSNLETVTVPNSVKSVGADAFEGCEKLKYNEYDNAYYLGNRDNLFVAVIKNKDGPITSCKINSEANAISSSAFKGCSDLETVNFSNKISAIGSSAFKYCSKLVTIDFEGTVAEWKAIIKGAYWNSETGEYVVYCSDGEITKASDK